MRDGQGNQHGSEGRVLSQAQCSPATCKVGVTRAQTGPRPSPGTDEGHKQTGSGSSLSPERALPTQFLLKSFTFKKCGQINTMDTCVPFTHVLQWLAICLICFVARPP